MRRRDPSGWRALFTCAPWLAPVLLTCSAHAQTGQRVFVLYAKHEDDNVAEQHLTYACSTLATAKSKDPIFLLDRTDSALALVRKVIRREKDYVPPKADPTSDPCAEASASATPANLRDCLVNRINGLWNSEDNSSLTRCFDPDVPVNASALVAVGFEQKADDTGSLLYERFRIEPGGVEKENVQYLPISSIGFAAITGIRTALGLEEVSEDDPPVRPAAGSDPVPAGADRRGDDGPVPVRFPWVPVVSAGAVAGVAGVVAAVLTIDANKKWHAAKADCTPQVTPGVCPADSQGPSLSRDATRSGDWATGFTIASAVGGAVLVGTLVYHYWLRPETTSKDASTATARLPAVDVDVSRDSVRVTIGSNF